MTPDNPHAGEPMQAISDPLVVIGPHTGIVAERGAALALAPADHPAVHGLADVLFRAGGLAQIVTGVLYHELHALPSLGIVTCEPETTRLLVRGSVRAAVTLPDGTQRIVDGVGLASWTETLLPPGCIVTLVSTDETEGGGPWVAVGPGLGPAGRLAVRTVAPASASPVVGSPAHPEPPEGASPPTAAEEHPRPPAPPDQVPPAADRPGPRPPAAETAREANAAPSGPLSPDPLPAAPPPPEALSLPVEPAPGPLSSAVADLDEHHLFDHTELRTPDAPGIDPPADPPAERPADGFALVEPDEVSPPTLHPTAPPSPLPPPPPPAPDHTGVPPSSGPAPRPPLQSEQRPDPTSGPHAPKASSDIPPAQPSDGLITSVPGMSPPTPVLPSASPDTDTAHDASAAASSTTAVDPPASSGPTGPAVELPPLVDDPPDTGLDDATVSLAARRAAAAATPDTPRVQAVLCPSGHPNPTHADRCRTCAQPVVDRQVHVVARPSLGRITFPTGTTVELDQHLVLGRRPAADPIVAHEPHGLVTVPDDEEVVSRTHLVLRIEGWQVHAIDRDSTNNTFVEIPGQPPFQLRPGDPYPLPPGAVVRLGDEVSFTYDATAR